MELTIEKLPFGLRPETNGPDNDIYNYLGEDGVRKLVSDHYDLLAESEIKNLFPPVGMALEIAKKRSSDFFIQKLGGPEYFNQNRGKPMLANRHLPFKITPSARLVWLDLYRKLLVKLEVPESLIMAYWKYLHDFSNWMVNTPE
jgi:hemoglobin